MSDSKNLKEDIQDVKIELKELKNEMSTMNGTLIRQEMHLAEHIRRTGLAEENIALLRNELKPVSKHVNMVEGALKLIGIVATLSAIYATIVKLI